MGIEAVLQQFLGINSQGEKSAILSETDLFPNPPAPTPLCNSASSFEIVPNSPENSSSQASSLLRSVRLFGEAIPMGQSTSMSSLFFNDVKVGSSSSQSFSLNNTDSCPVNFSISYPSGFSVSPISGTVNGGGSQYITVTFSPSSEQSYSGSLSITNGFPSVSVSGKCVK